MASLKDWGAIEASDVYQNANEAQRSQMQNQYLSAGGVIPQLSPEIKETGVLDTIGNFAADTLKSGAAKVGRDVARGIGGAVELADTLSNKAVGMPPSSLSTYGRRIQKNAENLYNTRMKEIGDTAGAKTGNFAGGIVSDVGMMIANPAIAIPTIAALEAGNALADQPENNRNLTNAVNVGGANALANMLLPGGGGKAAEGLINGAMSFAKDVGRNALVGAEGGLATGAANTVNRNPDADLGQVITGGLEGSGEGAIFGGAFGGASNIANRIGGSRGGEISPTQDTPNQSRQPDFDNPAHSQAVRGSEILADRGVPLLDSRLANDPDAMAAFGRTEADVNKSRKSSRESATNTMIPFKTNITDPGKMAVTKNDIEIGGKALVSDVKGNLESTRNNVDRMYETLNNELNASAVGSPTNSAAKRAELAPVDNFRQAFGDYQKAMNSVDGGKGIKNEALMDSAQRVKDAFDATPDYFKQDFMKQYKDVDGFTQGFDPVAHAAEYNSAFNQLYNMHPNFRQSTTNPTQGRNADKVPRSLFDIAGATADTLKSGFSRRGLANEKARNLEQVRGLAQSQRAVLDSRRAAEEARRQMEEVTPVDDNVPPMEMSAPEQAVQNTAQEVYSIPDQRLVGSPRRPAREEPVVEQPEPTPEPEPTGVDQTLVSRPRRPVKEEPVVEAPREVDQTLVTRPRQLEREVPVEEPTPVQEPIVEPTPEPTPEPVSEPLPSANETPAQRYRRQQREADEIRQEALREQEAAAQTPPPEAPREVDQTMVSRPRQLEEPSPEPVQEALAPEPAPKEDVGFVQGAREAIDRRQLEATKNNFTTDEVRNKITRENMNDKHFLQQMRREDVANNYEYLHHAVEQVNKARKIREAKQHEINMNELEAWGKEFGIDQRFIDQAIKAKGLDHSKVLGINDIKVRASKAYENSLKPTTGTDTSTATETPKVDWKDQRSEYFNEIKGMHPEVQKAVMPIIAKAFRSSEKTDTALAPHEARELWKRVFNQDEAINRKLGRDKEAKEAEAKAKAQEQSQEQLEIENKAKAEKAEKAKKTAKDIQDLHDTSKQLEEIREGMLKEFKDADIPESQLNNFIDTYMDRNFGVTRRPLSQLKFQESVKTARNQANRFAKKHDTMTPAEAEAEVSGANGTLSEGNPELAKLNEEIKELKGKISKSKPEDSKEVVDNLTNEIVDKAEKALKDGDDVNAIAEAADVLSKAYFGNDPAAGFSLRRYAQKMAKAATFKELYPDQPALWLSKTDVNDISRANSPHANGLKSKLVDAVLGKNFDDVKLLSEGDRQKLAQMADRGELKGTIDVTTKKGRGALMGGESGKPRVTIKKTRKTPSKKSYNLSR